MTGFSELRWYPEALTARLNAAFIPAAEEFARAADAAAPAASIKVSARITGNLATISASSPGQFFESGTKPHTEQPKNQAMKLRDGSFVRGPVSHPGMGARPFLHPLLPAFATMYRRTASVATRL